MNPVEARATAPRRSRRRVVSRLCALLAVLAGGVAAVPPRAAHPQFTATASVSGNTMSTAASFPVCYRDAILADNPVAYWRLDETSGTVAADSKGTHAGTYVGGPTLGQSGALPDSVNDRAASFDGVDDRVEVPASASLPGTSQITIEAWIRPTDTTGPHTILEYADSNNVGVHLWQYDHGNPDEGQHLYANVIGTDFTSHQVVSGPVLQANTWFHVALTYDGSDAVLYVDGTEVGRASFGSFTPLTSLPVNIGHRPVTGDSLANALFAGKIDEVAVYGTALSGAQLRAHYNTGRCYKDGVLADHPVGYWRLGETGGTTAADGIAGRNGTYANGPTLNQTAALDGDTDPSVTFDGVNDAVAVPYSGALNPGRFTIEAWAKPTGGAGTWRTVLSTYRYGGNWGYGIWGGTDDRWQAWVADGSGGYTVASAPMTMGSWAHLVATYDGTTLRLYVDGVPADSADGGYAPNTVVPLGIGAASYDGSTWQHFFPGSIDEVAVYDTVLSDARVEAHYLLGRSYRSTVLDSRPVSYWRLGESSGASATDVEGVNDGTYTGGPTLGRPGALAAYGDTAVDFDGSDDLVTTTNPISGPDVFSEEAWFTTTTTAGGKIVGFEDSNTASDGGNYDRMIYMADDGTLVFAVWPNSYVTVQSARAYNDGAWHHAVATMDAGGMVLYVDGIAVGSDPNSAAQSFSGYWRIGEGNLYTWSPEPTSYAFAGTIDDVAVYDRALTAPEVALHYDSGRQ